LIAVPIISAVCALVAASLCFVCFRAVSRSLPVQVVRDLKIVDAELQAVRDTQESHLVKLVTWREDMEGVLEAVESTLDRVETKRRSAASSAARIAGKLNGGEPEFDPTNRAHLLTRARQLGITDAV